MTSAVYSSYPSSKYCPPDFVIPTKEFYKSLISDLRSNAYSVLTDKNGLNMSENLYYLTSNYTKTSSFGFTFLYFQDGKVKLEDKDATKIGYGSKISIKYALSPPKVKLLFTDYEGNIKFNTSTTIKTDGNYFNGYLWRIGSKIYETNEIKQSFNKSE